ncbi:mycothiol transferase [Tessaracoccus sp. G1721]
MDAIDILLDAASRPLDALENLRPHLTAEVLNRHPAGHDNSVAWLLWHTGREIDVQLAHLSGDKEVWTTQGFRGRLALGAVADKVGYGHTPEQARAIVVADAAPLVAYVSAAVEALKGYIGGLEDADLDDVVDRRWDPPVTRGVRLVSIIDDAAQHLAQAAYVCGMPGHPPAG